MSNKTISTSLNPEEVKRYLKIRTFSDVILVDPKKEYKISEIAEILDVSENQVEKIIELGHMTQNGYSIINFIKT